MSDLPRLYTMAEICAATQYSADTIRRVLNASPQIRPIGNGRGIRFAQEDYNALVEVLQVAGRRPKEIGKRLRRIRRRDLRHKQQVYFIQSESGHIKIGIAYDLKSRLYDLQNACPFRLTLLGSIPGGAPVEQALHTEFSAHRETGEWFNPAPDLLARIEELLGT